MLVKAADLKSVPEVESQIKALGYETSSYEDMRKSLEEQSRAIQLILGGIGAVSLLVAAIGIANTMVMSVTERTREIGIKKALGARRSDILVQFLLEALIISIVGGALGIAVGIAMGMLSSTVGMAFVVSWNIVWVAVAASTAIGLVFGIFPAYRASRKNPIEALRAE